MYAVLTAYDVRYNLAEWEVSTAECMEDAEELVSIFMSSARVVGVMVTEVGEN